MNFCFQVSSLLIKKSKESMSIVRMLYGSQVVLKLTKFSQLLAPAWYYLLIAIYCQHCGQYMSVISITSTPQHKHEQYLPTMCLVYTLKTMRQRNRSPSALPLLRSLLSVTCTSIQTSFSSASAVANYTRIISECTRNFWKI